jgi:inner membrane protein
MTGRTHDLAAVTALSVVFLSNPVQPLRLSTAIVAVIANLIGGITPDIDQPTAPFWRNLPIGNMFGRTFGKLTGGHRFLTHSAIGLSLIGFAAHWLLVFLSPVMGNIDIGYVWWAYMIGVASHIAMDMFTKEGVPILLPLPYKFGFPPIKALRITTDRWVEHLIVFPGMLTFNGLWFAAHYQEILEIMRRIGVSH